jgi:hypothetical protein
VSALPDLLGSLVAIYPHPPATEARMRAYMALLSDLTDAECAVAFHRLGNEPGRKFYPAPGEIREAARPTAKAVDVVDLYEHIENHLLFHRGTLATVEEKWGSAARLAVQSAGGVEAVRCFQEYRAIKLKDFTAAYLQADTTERVALGPVDDRVKQLVSGIGR